MTWRPRMVALDVDGTLLETGKAVRPAVRTAVGDVVESGAHLVLASARSDVEILPVIDDLGLVDGHAVCCNGALTIRYPSRTVVEITKFDARDALRDILRSAPAAQVAVDEIGFGYDVTAYFPADELPAPQRLRALDAMIEQPVHHVIVRDPTVADLASVATRHDFRRFSVSVSEEGWLDLVSRSVSKASALANLARAFDVDAADCLAIGNGHNDVEMLAWAGRGVAMAQSPPAVLHAADALTGSVDDDGVATELRRWFAPPVASVLSR